MIELEYTPQRSDVIWEYEIEGNFIYCNGEKILDITNYDEKNLPIQIATVRYEDGVYIVRVIKTHGPDASDDERFPS